MIEVGAELSALSAALASDIADPGRSKSALGNLDKLENVKQRPTVAPLLYRSNCSVFVLHLAELAPPNASNGLQKHVPRPIDAYAGAPLVVDLDGTTGGTAADFIKLVTALRQQGLVPMAVRNGDERQNSAAEAAGLAILQDASLVPDALSQIMPAASVRTRARSLLVEQPVRAGTSIDGHDRDVIATASVGEGSELVADGNIHVYGALRGTAHAGASGDVEARIFCSRNEAEQVSIAGIERYRDSFPQESIGRPAQFRLIGGRIVIETMSGFDASVA